MHDFGEYTPFDVSVDSQMDPFLFHNDFPLEWAKVNREAEQESSLGEEIVSFMRAGSTMSPAFTDLFWMGDQLPTYDRFDGLHSTVIGLMNGGLSGFSWGHSDIGGYTTFKLLAYEMLRDKQLTMRWIESNTFSDIVLRTHPSNNPSKNWHIYSDDETAQFMAYFGSIHKALAPYKRTLMTEATTRGIPITRPLFLEFP
mmetsp:Transcript_18388/g.17493  ORF Transcript_18388/g.17493 Transcript_18388/m.17493 type:complete len:199 (+) Transcript_18388:1082-1678(+)